jgi:PAS domain S-box-containing protein
VSDEKFKRIFEISPDSTSINRLKDGKFVSVNRTFEKTVGYSKEEVTGELRKKSVCGWIGLKGKKF